MGKDEYVKLSDVIRLIGSFDLYCSEIDDFRGRDLFESFKREVCRLPKTKLINKQPTRP